MIPFPLSSLPFSIAVLTGLFLRHSSASCSAWFCAPAVFPLSLRFSAPFCPCAFCYVVFGGFSLTWVVSMKFCRLHCSSGENIKAWCPAICRKKVSSFLVRYENLYLFLNEAGLQVWAPSGVFCCQFSSYSSPTCQRISRSRLGEGKYRGYLPGGSSGGVRG